MSVLQKFWSWSTSVGCLVSIGHFRARNMSSTSSKALVTNSSPFLLQKMHPLGLSVCRGQERIQTSCNHHGFRGNISRELDICSLVYPCLAEQLLHAFSLWQNSTNCKSAWDKDFSWGNRFPSLFLYSNYYYLADKSDNQEAQEEGEQCCGIDSCAGTGRC